MNINSTYDIGDVVQFLDNSDNTYTGVIYAITVAEVGPNVVGFWYKVFVKDGEKETEMEFEEAGNEIIVLQKAKD
jgi:hypothetical protein